MGEHLTESGEFKSDKYPWSPPGFVSLKLTDPMAQPFLWGYAEIRRQKDQEFSDDLHEALRLTGYDPESYFAYVRKVPAILPPNIKAGIDDYHEHHQPVGGFLTAILNNDLSGAFVRADPQSKAYLAEIIDYVRFELPSDIWGSPDKVQSWLAEKK